LLFPIFFHHLILLHGGFNSRDGRVNLSQLLDLASGVSPPLSLPLLWRSAATASQVSLTAPAKVPCLVWWLKLASTYIIRRAWKKGGDGSFACALCLKFLNTVVFSFLFLGRVRFKECLPVLARMPPASC
jgi:hypothetical protein